MTGSFLDAVIDTELTVLQRRLLGVTVDNADDLNVFVLRTAQVQLNEVGRLKASTFEV